MRLTRKQTDILYKKLEDAINEVEKEWTVRAERVPDLGEPSSVLMEIKLDLNFQHDNVKKISVYPLVVVDRYA